jgi:tetratricopeptide (TPR) repeat protein
MMRDFAATVPTARVIEKELGLKPEEFDRRFLGALEAETKPVVAGFDEWRKRMRQLAEAARAGRHDEVIREAPAVRDLYPEYVEAGSAYELLAGAHLAGNNQRAAIAELERYMKAGGRSPATLKRLAALLAESGRQSDAAAALDRLIYVSPVDEELHRRLGDLRMAERDWNGAVREYRALIAMNPGDPADSHFQLAQALKNANRIEEAKDQLLLALEAAPGYRPAQKLLLDLSRK